MNRQTNRSVFVNARPLVLASASPRRADLLASAGLDFTVLPADAAEPEPGIGETAEAYAIRSAKAKAQAIASQSPAEADILAADTVVVLDEGQEEVILGKPRNDAEALAMLRRLRGRWHKVVTGVCLLILDGEGGEKRLKKYFSVTSEVYFDDWDDAVLQSYVATGEPMGKAGAYAIQGHGAALVKEVRGSYTNVVGLPLAEVVEVLGSWGVIVPAQG